MTSTERSRAHPTHPNHYRRFVRHATGARNVWRTHGLWHVYASYAKMAGQKGAVVGWVLLGDGAFDQRYRPAAGSDPIGSVTVRLLGVKSGDSSGNVSVTVSRIPYDDFGEVTETEVVRVSNRALPVSSSGHVDITFDWDRADSGHFIEVTNIVRR